MSVTVPSTLDIDLDGKFFTLEFTASGNGIISICDAETGAAVRLFVGAPVQVQRFIALLEAGGLS